jgi:hypothetical protein
MLIFMYILATFSKGRNFIQLSGHTDDMSHRKVVNNLFETADIVLTFQLNRVLKRGKISLFGGKWNEV